MAKMKFPFYIKLDGKYIGKNINIEFEASDEEIESLIHQGGETVNGGDNNGSSRKAETKTSRRKQ